MPLLTSSSRVAIGYVTGALFLYEPGFLVFESTVPTFNFCNKCVGRQGQNTRPHARLPPSFIGMGAWMTSQLIVALIPKLRESLMCLACFFDMLFMGAVQPGTARRAVL